jgi:hypothetical protein
VSEGASVMLRVLCALLVAFVAGAGFLFGQLFTGTFSWGGTLAGAGGLAVALLAWFTRITFVSRLVVVTAATALAGASLHAYEYYSRPHVSGNYYAWFLTAPFMLGVVVLAWLSLRRVPAAD